jgi:hypothetical protein
MVLSKRSFVISGAAALIGALLTTLVYAQMTPIYRFRDVQIPLDIKIEAKVLTKGAFDVEFMRTSSPVLYYLKFMRRGKILGIVQGEEWPYAGGVISDVPKDKTIPKSPTMKMTINRTDQLLNFVVESGKNALVYPLVRARFKLPIAD